MAEEEFAIVHLRDDFFRDGSNKVLLALTMMIAATGLLMALSFYLFLSKPKPITFTTEEDWRIISPVPVDQPYLKSADVLQWVSTIAPTLFTFDFVNYSDQSKKLTQYFTENGWKKYLDQQNMYVNQTNIEASKMFVNAVPDGAPLITNQGLLLGKYVWWVQIPMTVRYSNYEKKSSQSLIFQILVTRIPTLDNLDGIAIDNLIIATKNNAGV